MPEATAQQDTWTAPVADGPVNGRVRVPGSKSITNRAYVLAALAGSPTLVRDPLVSRDTRLMLAAIGALGGGHAETGADVRVTPVSAGRGTAGIALGNAGTVARFTPALAALGTREVRFDGDEAIRRRPLAPLLGALTGLGADIDDGGRGAPPFTVRGRGGLRGGAVELDSSASSQFLSALLLAGPGFGEGVTVRLVGGAPPSEPHIAMTLDLLRRFGAAPERDGSRFHVPAADLALAEYVVEPDLSTAAPFVVAALAAGGSTHVEGWPAETTQPGDWLRSLVTELGGSAELGPDGLTVTGTGEIPGVSLDLHEVGELTPVVAALLCFADGPSEISGVAHLRGHETDRLAALAAELSALGANVTDTADGLRIIPAPMRGGTFHTYDDHRLVMAGAVLGLRIPGVLVENPATVGKTFPGFVSAWDTLVTRTSD
ncbi:3-phosphoshikimate 1-carboxyvinyltransferase [Amycolatopsis antarctica]|uniref:3-phosphoshikimate 1-carboxyvinyltransferase n=1 Tax=Amycolatopsis antarctica TaxID=1854586 RepID=A0A263D0H8_9PSEU|nr:3-phosphoshikimate 1-carboxyvinyltransferase [Amycolatopsis antarctica]OZM70865.1 3-phosphoshikimate 1-carboxyvinyltransferase [Amycolatopsis antarctica]